MDEKKPPVEEVNRMHHLLKKARKKKRRPTAGSKRVKSSAAMGSVMDEMETLPFDQVSVIWSMHFVNSVTDCVPSGLVILDKVQR